MPWAKTEPDSFWDNIRVLLLLGHRPGHISKIYEHKGDILQKIRWRSHEYWKDISVARSSHRGPRCPGCRLRLPTFKKDYCKQCYYRVIAKGRPEGDKHHAWKGGTSFDPDRVRVSTEYRQFRKQVMEEFDYTCAICGRIEDVMELDHLVPLAARPDLLLERDNVRVLCPRCHKKTASHSSNAKYFKWLFVAGRLTLEEKLEKFEELLDQGVITGVEMAAIRRYLPGDGKLNP